MKKSIIYVRLLDEGTEVYRPVDALHIGDMRYQILGHDIYDLNDEKWEFPPGSCVEGIERSSYQEIILVAQALCEL
nr:hypothetical protein [uncultured Mucilaginibacter sp.]